MSGGIEGGDATHSRQILALEPDLFFAVKITETLKRGGFQTRVSRSVAQFVELLSAGAYRVVLINTAARGIDWRAGIDAARAAHASVIAYGSHVDLETQAAARKAGATRVIANSRLENLASIVERVIARAAGNATPQGDDPDESTTDLAEDGNDVR